jgi:hypothetical protein
MTDTIQIHNPTSEKHLKINKIIEFKSVSKAIFKNGEIVKEVSELSDTKLLI